MRRWTSDASWPTRRIRRLRTTPSRLIGESALTWIPDFLLGWQQACGGQVLVLDRCLELLLASIDLQRWLVAVVAPRGYPLGEHGRLGGTDTFHSELLQVPMLFRYPRQRGAAIRCSRFVQETELGARIAHWHGVDPRVAAVDVARFAWPPGEQVAVARGQGQWALRTGAWHLNASESDPGGDGRAVRQARRPLGGQQRGKSLPASR